MEEYVNIKAFIETLNANGVGYVFFNPGIDNVPMLETISKYRTSGEHAPRNILCLDEFLNPISPPTVASASKDQSRIKKRKKG